MSSPAPRGFSLPELMIAILIMCTALATVVLITFGIPSAIKDGRDEEIGASVASALLEKQFMLGLHSFSSVIPLATTYSTGNPSDPVYTISLSVTLLPDGLTKRLTSSASWIDSKNKSESISFSAVITNLLEAIGNSCGDVLTGDWTHPSISTFLTAPIGVLATDASTLVAAATTTKNKTDPTLFFFSIASSSNPTQFGSLDAATTTRAGFAALTIHNNLVFGASDNSANFATCIAGPACSQLQIIDDSDPTNPSVLTDFKLASTSAPYATGSGGQSAGRSIFYNNGLIYLGLQKTASSSENLQGDEFNIINVENPQSPTWLGGYSVGRTVNQIQVTGDYAYLATDDPDRELIILDVHDPAHITLAGSYDAPGDSTFGFGEALAVASTSLLLGRSYIQNEPEFSVLTIASGVTPVLLGQEPITQFNTASIQDLVMRSFVAFVLTDSSLQFWDLTNPSQPVSFASSITLQGVRSVTSNNGLACRNNTLYVASTDSTHAGHLTVITGS